jgi:hypothetical protein
MNIGAQKLMQFICIVHTNVHDISTNRKKLNPPQGQQQRRLHEGTLLFISTGRENYMSRIYHIGHSIPRVCKSGRTPASPSFTAVEATYSTRIIPLRWRCSIHTAASACRVRSPVTPAVSGHTSRNRCTRKGVSLMCRTISTIDSRILSSTVHPPPPPLRCSHLPRSGTPPAYIGCIRK